MKNIYHNLVVYSDRTLEKRLLKFANIEGTSSSRTEEQVPSNETEKDIEKILDKARKEREDLRSQVDEVQKQEKLKEYVQKYRHLLEIAEKNPAIKKNFSAAHLLSLEMTVRFIQQNIHVLDGENKQQVEQGALEKMYVRDRSENENGQTTGGVVDFAGNDSPDDLIGLGHILPNEAKFVAVWKDGHGVPQVGKRQVSTKQDGVSELVGYWEIGGSDYLEVHSGYRFQVFYTSEELENWSKEQTLDLSGEMENLNNYSVPTYEEEERANIEWAKDVEQREKLYAQPSQVAKRIMNESAVVPSGFKDKISGKEQLSVSEAISFASEQTGASVKELTGLFNIESSLNPKARNSGGYKGLGQLGRPAIADALVEMGVPFGRAGVEARQIHSSDDVFNPAINALLSAVYWNICKRDASNASGSEPGFVQTYMVYNQGRGHGKQIVSEINDPNEYYKHRLVQGNNDWQPGGYILGKISDNGLDTVQLAQQSVTPDWIAKKETILAADELPDNIDNILAAHLKHTVSSRRLKFMQPAAKEMMFRLVQRFPNVIFSSTVRTVEENMALRRRGLPAAKDSDHQYGLSFDVSQRSSGHSLSTMVGYLKQQYGESVYALVHGEGSNRHLHVSCRHNSKPIRDGIARVENQDLRPS